MIYKILRRRVNTAVFLHITVSKYSGIQFGACTYKCQVNTSLVFVSTSLAVYLIDMGYSSQCLYVIMIDVDQILVLSVFIHLYRHLHFV